VAGQQRTYTYDDLADFPDDGLRRELIDGELIDGELIVSPSPVKRHQRVVANLTAEQLVRNRRIYERERCREFWFVDLDADRVEAYRLGEEGFGPPTIIERGGTLTTPLLDGVAIDVDALLGPVEDG
jgi:Uma2 family endonuclease